MDLQLNGLRALVTGGTRGIGRAIVDLLVDEGAAVSFCARTESEVTAQADELRNAGHRAVGYPVDVAEDGQALHRWVDASAAELGGVDVVVANVSALAIPDEEDNWKASFDVDMMGTVRSVQAALPHLERSPNPAIVTLSSVSGREIDFAAGPYGSVKAAIVHYTQGIANQFAEKGIRANSVSPGNVYFEGGVWGNAEKNSPDFFSHVLSLNPTGRMATPREVARAVVFLASPAASFTTGTNLLVDGALTRGVQL